MSNFPLIFTQIGFLFGTKQVVLSIDPNDKGAMSEFFDKSQMSESFDVPAGCISKLDKVRDVNLSHLFYPITFIQGKECLLS